MRLTVVLSLLFGVLVAATPVRRDDDFQDEDDFLNDPENQEEDKVTEDEDIAEEDPADYAEESETEDEPEKDQENDQEDEQGDYISEAEDGLAFNCSGKPGAKPDGTTIKYTDPNSQHHWYECLGGVAKRYGCTPSHLIFSDPFQYCIAPGSSGFTCVGKLGAKPDGTTIKYTDPNSKHHWYECLGGVAKKYGCTPSHLVFSEPVQYCI